MPSKEFWLALENHATVKLDSSVAASGMKTYSESKIELRHLKILRKMLESSEQPGEPKSLDIALNIVGVEKYTRKLAFAVNNGDHYIRVLIERKLVTVSGNLCPL